jgi:hypothetical protein
MLSKHSINLTVVCQQMTCRAFLLHKSYLPVSIQSSAETGTELCTYANQVLFNYDTEIKENHLSHMLELKL